MNHQCDNCNSQATCFRVMVPCVNIDCDNEFEHYFCSPQCEKDFDVFYSDSVTCDVHNDDAAL
jgi:hypothetical protein